MTAIQNTSGLKPLGRAVLVKHYEPERSNSVIVVPEQAHGRMMMVEQRAVVIETGPACWPDEPPRAKPGDRVLISRMAGYQTNQSRDGELYRFVNDADIFALIVEE